MSTNILTGKTSEGSIKIRVMLHSKGRPRADQSPMQVTTELPHGAREFEHAGKRYKLTWLHEGDKSGVLEADAEECQMRAIAPLNLRGHGHAPRLERPIRDF